MSDMKKVIEPKSDQLNADDMISGPITVKITAVNIKSGGEQPVAISYEGDNGKPYKPCKGMCRVMVSVWGNESKNYVGKSMTLFRNPDVKWAGLAVGGIQISHMSDMDESMTMALTASKGSRKPFTVRPLESAAAATTDNITTEQANAIAKRLEDGGIELAAFLKGIKISKLTDMVQDDLPKANTLIDRKLASMRALGDTV